METLGGAVRPSASKNCWTLAIPVAPCTLTGYSQPLVRYHFSTAPFSKSAAASRGCALAFSAICRGVDAPASAPDGYGVTGTCTRTRTVWFPPLDSMTNRSEEHTSELQSHL